LGLWRCISGLNLRGEFRFGKRRVPPWFLVSADSKKKKQTVLIV
jgi:hypothetical protein